MTIHYEADNCFLNSLLCFSCVCYAWTEESVKIYDPIVWGDIVAMKNQINGIKEGLTLC